VDWYQVESFAKTLTTQSDKEIGIDIPFDKLSTIVTLPFIIM